ncbi:unnamed protein product [Linum tenue]|uniref:Uncharacterized protein n=2 Tax=Linum tenue TaxID=586396 RepID=A0AAV0NX46_9ROSI|nr:unnamed protein product [Linum tenue]
MCSQNWLLNEVKGVSKVTHDLSHATIDDENAEDADFDEDGEEHDN